MPDFTDDDLDRAQKKARPKGKLPYLPDDGSLDALAEWLVRAFKPPAHFTLEAFDRAGKLRTHPCSITFRNGRDRKTFRFGAQSDLQGSRLRASVLAISDGWLRMPHLTDSEKDDVWAALCIFGRVMSETDDRDETRKWIEHLLDVATVLREFTLVPDGRHDGLMALRGQGEFKAADARRLGAGDENGRRPVRFVDKHTGEQWIRAGETFTFIKWVEGADRLDRADLRARLSEIGVESFNREDHRPPHPKATLYRLTEGLVEYVDGRLGEK
jgi:hypothetical protein